MALTVTDNSVRQINAALLYLEKKIGETNSEKAQDKQAVQMEIKNTQYNFMAPLYQSGNSVNINTTGTWEGTARSATTAEHAITADEATTATTAETVNKVKNALTVNGKTYDGSSAVNAGVQTVANGGTGQTTASAAANSFINSLSVGTDTPVDNDYFISQYVNGGTTTTTYYRRTVSKLWEYIKGKISSVLGLTATAYSGKANTAGTADSAKNMYSQTLDLSSLDKTKFYPIFCISKDDFGEVAIHSPGFGGSEPYNQNRIHFDISTFGWNDAPYTLNIREYACYDNSEITIGCIGRGTHQGCWAIWLRGGFNYSCWTRNCKLSLKTSDYTWYDEKYTVGTNYYGGENTNVSIMFTPQSTITDGAYSNRNVVAPNITSIEQRTASLESNKVNTTELDEKLNSPLPWRYNYLDSGYSSSLPYRKIGEGYFTYTDNINWSFHSEIEVLYHIPNGVVVRGTIFVSLRGRGSSINVKTVKYNSENGVFNYLSKTKVNYKLDTTNKRIYLELLAYCDVNYTMLLFRNSLTRTEDMLKNANNFWTFAATGNYTQSATTMQAGVTDGYTEIPLEVINVDRYGRDIVTTYATKAELTEAVAAYNSSGNAVGWVKPQKIKFADYKTGSLTFNTVGDQKKIELSNFGPEVTENNVLSFMVIYHNGVNVIAQGDWAQSQGTGSSGLACALHSLNTGTGYAVIRCVYLA